VGHSLSCQALLELAAAEPERARALVLAGPTGAPGRHRMLRQAQGLLRDLTRESMGLAFRVAVAYLQAGLPRIARTWWLGGRQDPLRAAPTVCPPTLVVVGDRDPVVPVSFARSLADALPKGRFELIPGGAHAMIFTDAPAFSTAVGEFLGRIG
jgi:pimeloyl-ACP methyl ester carboxylesterase